MRHNSSSDSSYKDRENKNITQYFTALEIYI
jgi:hypothetical protein